MAGVRVLVGTRKGAFVLTSDERRQGLGGRRAALRRLGDLPPEGVAGRPRPHLGEPVRRLVRPGRAALRRRRPHAGTPVGNEFRYDGVAGHPPVVRRHAAPVGVRPRLAPRAVARPTPTPSTPASRTRRCSRAPTAARPGPSCPGCATHGSGPQWQPGAGGLCLHTILLAPHRRAADVHRDLGGRRVPHRRRRRRAGRRSTRACCPAGSPTPTPRSATACTTSRCTRRGPRRCSCRSTGTSCAATTPAAPGTRSAATCRPTSASRSTCTRTSPRRSTSCRSQSDSKHFPPDGRLRVYRSRTGGGEWEPLTKGLPQEHCYVNVLRDAMAVDRLDDVRRLLRHDRRRRSTARPTAATRWDGDRARPAGGAVGRGADAAMTPPDPRRAARTTCARWRTVDGEVERRGGADAGEVLDALEAALPGAARDDARPGHRASGGRSCASSPAARTCRTTRPTTRCPARCCAARSRSSSSGRWPAAEPPPAASSLLRRRQHGAVTARQRRRHLRLLCSGSEQPTEGRP